MIMKYFTNFRVTVFVLEYMIIGLLAGHDEYILDRFRYMGVNTDWDPSSDECPTWEDLKAVKCQPLLIPKPNFDPSNDVEELFETFQDKNYNKLKNILVKTSDERVAIKDAFDKEYNTDLFRAFKAELNGTFKDLVLSLLKSKVDFYQDEIMTVLNLPEGMLLKSPIKINTLLEVIGCLSIQGLKALDASFLKTVNTGYCELIKEFLAPSIYRYDLTLCKMIERPEDLNVSESVMNMDLKCMLKAENRTDFNFLFMDIISSRSNAHLRKLLIAFEKETANDIWSYTKKIYRPWYLVPTTLEYYSMIDFWDIIRNRSLYFANRLYESLNNLKHPHDYDTIRRILIGRAEIDLGNILVAFENKYNMTLAYHIQKNITNKSDREYRDLLLEFIKSSPY